MNKAANMSQKNMGRGFIYLTLSSMIFALSGFVLHIGLARILGVREYGIYGIMMALVGIVSMLWQPGICITVTKFTSENLENADPVLKTAIRFQAAFGTCLAAITFLSAPLLAQFLKDSSLSSYIRLAILIIIPMGLNITYLASLNGARRYGELAISRIFHSAIKILLVFMIVLLGYKIKGVILGLLISSAMAAFVARHLCQYPKKDESFGMEKLLAFAASVVVYIFCITTIMNLDLLFVKSLIKNSDAPGLYTAATNISKLPYMFFQSFSAVLLPSISQAFSENDMESVKKYMHQTLRYMFLGLLPLIVLLSANSEEVLEILYSDNFSGAIVPFSILVFGISFSGIFGVLSTVVIGSGSPRVAMAAALILLPLDIALNLFLIPKYGLVGAASATTLTFLSGSIWVGIYIYSRFKALIHFSSALKIGFASIIIYTLSVNYPFQGLWMLLQCILLFVLYIFILMALREISSEDVKVFKAIIMKVKK